MSYAKGELLYEGKAKMIFAVEDHDDLVWVSFKDSLTAFNAEKQGEFAGKGAVNKAITSKIFKELGEHGVNTHWVEDVSKTEAVCQKLKIIPLEVVVRNALAGSTAKRLGFEEGHKIESPLVEFYYKKDELGDPFINDEHAILLQAADRNEIQELKNLALFVNNKLQSVFANTGIDLIDFKLEFGKSEAGQLVLADEISPDSCRLWDQKTGERMDKDRFRRDLGGVEENYKEVLNRLTKELGE